MLLSTDTRAIRTPARPPGLIFSANAPLPLQSSRGRLDPPLTDRGPCCVRSRRRRHFIPPSFATPPADVRESRRRQVRGPRPAPGRAHFKSRIFPLAFSHMSEDMVHHLQTFKQARIDSRHVYGYSLNMSRAHVSTLPTSNVAVYTLEISNDQGKKITVRNQRADDRNRLLAALSQEYDEVTADAIPVLSTAATEMWGRR